ncbi:MAG: inorganic phosphate transporter [Bacteroidales bacterium]|nr:inorganic phosphate transporter [Bacteroidales bacterium]
MISPLFNHLLIPFLIAIFLAINMGGSGTAPSFSAAYGANILRKSVIPGFFGIMVFAGALIAGKATATTVGKELLPAEMMSFSLVSIILFSVGISLFIANLIGIPQSTSQATILAVTGPACYFSVLNERKLLLEIIPAWFILPVISFILCYIIGKYIYTPMRKKGYFTFNGISSHPIIKILIIIMSAYVAFAIGANNVANASGPIASMTINELNIKDEGNNFIIIMILSTLIIAPSFGIGSSIFGHKLVRQTGKGIFLFGPIEAIFISFITASLLLLASVLKGIPSSLVQVNTASIIGLGVARLGFKNILKKTSVNKFFIVWAIAPIFSFLLSIFLTYLADITGLLYLYK